MPPPSRACHRGRCAVATSQPLATSAGLSTLLLGGNATDAAIAIATVLSVTEPCSNGPGGDAFALIYTGATQTVTSVHGNGSSASGLTAGLLGEKPSVDNVHCIVVPGAVRVWVDVLERFGRIGKGVEGRRRVFRAAIEIAEEGFALGPVTARGWKNGERVLKKGKGGSELLVSDGNGRFRAPKEGEVFRNLGLARVLRRIVEEGGDGFYKGEVAKAIVDVVSELGGVLTMKDLEDHCTEFKEGIWRDYRGIRIWECGPPGHGVVALMGLGVMEGWSGEIEEDAAVHLMVEAMRMGFGEAGKVVADGKWCGEHKVAELLAGIEHMRNRVDMEKKGKVVWGGVVPGGGTVQFCVVDGEGNGVSMVQSNYMGFGTGHVPRGMGFSLNNRGLNFTVGDMSHVNCVGGGKKPYHTIIPGLMTGKKGQLVGVFGMMGSFMQPQGHIQLIRGLLDCGLNAQEALDQARFRVTGPFSSVEEGMGEDEILVEEEFDERIVESLRKKGHVVKVGNREVFGRGQVIMVRAGGIVEAGSDNRADGCAGVLW